MGELLAGTHDKTQPFLAASVLSHQPRFFARGLKWSLRAQNLSLKATGAGNPDFADIPIGDKNELQIWGVVTRVLHAV